MPRQTRATLCTALRDLVVYAEQLERENAALRLQTDWHDDQQRRGYENRARFVPILPRKVA